MGIVCFYHKKQICKLLGDSWFIDIAMGLRLHPELGNSPVTSTKAGGNSQGLSVNTGSLGGMDI